MRNFNVVTRDMLIRARAWESAAARAAQRAESIDRTTVILAACRLAGLDLEAVRETMSDVKAWARAAAVANLLSDLLDVYGRPGGPSHEPPRAA